MNPRVCVLTVTYGSRFHLVQQVVERCFEEGVSHVVVVDNASHEESRSQLVQYAKGQGERMTLLLLDANFGSAGGYKRGLEKIQRDIDCEYIWLLDDDNLPEKGCLEKLLLANAYLSGLSYPYALLCHRPMELVSRMALYHPVDFTIKNNAFDNAFAANNILRKLPRFWEKLFPKPGKENTQICFPLGITDAAPYGGFFFSKSWLDSIGYPREDFFTYADDIEYTYRVTQKGGAIYRCSEARITDIDWSGTPHTHRHFLLDPKASEFKLYYYLRNSVFLFSRLFKTNGFIYTVNMVLWWIWLILRALPHLPLFFKRLPMILRAIHDGHKGKLGKTL